MKTEKGMREKENIDRNMKTQGEQKKRRKENRE